MDRIDVTCNAADRVAVDETGCGAVITAHHADHNLTAERCKACSVHPASQGRLSLSKNMRPRSAGGRPLLDEFFRRQASEGI